MEDIIRGFIHTFFGELSMKKIDKVIVLGGVGAVGIEASRDLVEYSDFSEIMIADFNIKKAKAFKREVKDRRVEIMKIDVNNEDELKNALKNYDIVTNALPFKYDDVVTKWAVRLGVHGVDVAASEYQLSLSPKAKEKGITFVPGIGATPGTTNLMAKKGVQLLDKVEEIEIFWAAFRCTAPSPGLLYTTIWEFEPELEDRVIYENGEFKQMPPFVGNKEVEFHEWIGKRLTVIVPHSETRTLPMLVPDIKRVVVRGTWPDETMDLLKTLLYYGFYENKPVDFDGVSIKPMSFMYKFLLQSPYAKKTKVWAYGLVVDVYGEKNGKKAMVRLKNWHPKPEEWGGERAYFKPIGIPLSIGTQFIAKGRVSGPGVLPPELAYDPDEFFEELERREIKITWELKYL